MSSSPNRTLIKLGKKEISLRFDMAAIITLDELGINIYNPSTYAAFSPSKLRDLVWAGQLYREEPLTVHEIAKLLPAKLEDYGLVAKAIAQAIANAISPSKE